MPVTHEYLPGPALPNRSLSTGRQALETYGDPSPAFDPIVKPCEVAQSHLTMIAGMDAEYIALPWSLPAGSILRSLCQYLADTVADVLPSADDDDSLIAAMVTFHAILTGAIDPDEYELPSPIERATRSRKPLTTKLPGEGFADDNVRMQTAPIPFTTTAGVPVRRDGTIRASRRRMYVVGDVCDLPSTCRSNTYALMAWADARLVAAGRTDLTEISEDKQYAEVGQSECILSEVHVVMHPKLPRPIRTPGRDVVTPIPADHAFTFTSCTTLTELAANYTARETTENSPGKAYRYLGHRPCSYFVPRIKVRKAKAVALVAATADEAAEIAERESLAVAKTGGAFTVTYGDLRIRVNHKPGALFRMRIGVVGDSAHAKQVNVRAPQHVGATLRNRLT